MLSLVMALISGAGFESLSRPLGMFNVNDFRLISVRMRAYGTVLAKCHYEACYYSVSM